MTHLSRNSIDRSLQRRPKIISRFGWRLAVLCCSGLIAGVIALTGPLGNSAIAQSSNVQKQEDKVIQDFALPSSPPQPPVYQPAPPPAPEPAPDPAPAPASEPAFVPESAPEPPRASSAPAPKPAPPKSADAKPATKAPISQYVLEFNRSPIVGNRLRLQGVYAESRLGFTRPQSWSVQSAKAVIRYQHSPALVAERSNLTVLVNGTSVGSTPLNRKDSKIGELLVNIPTSLIQDSNSIAVAVQQNTDPKCSNSSDPNLWTEVLPDSKLVFGYQSQAIPLDFSRFPLPIFDTLSLDANQLVYLEPAQVNDAWLTTAGRFQTLMGRLAEFRPLETRVAKNLDNLNWNDRLVLIGTPTEQPLLKSLKLPFAIANSQVLDGNKKALPNDVGVLMLASTPNNTNPVLIATGNGPQGVAKAVQFLAQPKNRQIGTGQAILVKDVPDAESPAPRAWSRHLPLENSFKLADLRTSTNQPYQDITVRGSNAPSIEIDFRALPDDRFTRGNSMTLLYSYGPQVNPRTSSLDVAIDGVAIGGKPLTSDQGSDRERVNITLPEGLITPTSKLQVSFRLDPKESARCGIITDQQLWGTLHNDTSFNLSRENSVTLPDLKLLQVGYPFAAPQDLSDLAIALPDTPSTADVQTLLDVSERLGRLTQADSIKLEAYRASTLPQPVRNDRNLIAIGTRDKFPLPDALRSDAGSFSLKNAFGRQSDQAQVQALPDNGGVIQQVISPWNRNRVLLALTSQTEQGLKAVQDVLHRDLWFYKLQGDTVLISTNQPNAPAYDPSAYKLQVLQRSQPRRIEQTTWLSKASRFFQEHWFLLPTAIVTLTLVLYGIAQLFLKRAGGMTDESGFKG
ncbi:cellulose biosynthesis cyclic di-GMP-binding regulatory protein BcsB [Leptolyngbya sp. FACHB-36]|uniref:cellulose biosynthesis cyclic di-GMP-binding regulatory protein BcsB n=1 Tax=Leptolyngbya sp. FACHB-36 TaxID=2692808 RepID=UPI001681A9A3|nr:cellulose biosynthesis cyclic di-GMP-binding regulatory protein BcsB [Leptolyngbya sp. FACHB-36]MBD2019117.1 cellulose biosynthesis cyclic di-GMP-binding regulatory protein BcsB [Leptolyngbya sp. FACHB-36]